MTQSWQLDDLDSSPDSVINLLRDSFSPCFDTEAPASQLLLENNYLHGCFLCRGQASNSGT